jgi:hypothetical protein
VLISLGALAGKNRQRISGYFDTCASIVGIAAISVLGFFAIRHIIKKAKSKTI